MVQSYENILLDSLCEKGFNGQIVIIIRYNYGLLWNIVLQIAMHKY